MRSRSRFQKTNRGGKSEMKQSQPNAVCVRQRPHKSSGLIGCTQISADFKTMQNLKRDT